MRTIALVSFLLALFALIFPIVFSIGDPIIQTDTTDNPEIILQDSTVQNKITYKDENTLIHLKHDDSIIEINMKEYLTGVVGAEMPATFDMEALKAQAVAARTYTMYKMQINPSANHPEADICDDSTCCKAYKNDNELKEKWGNSYSAYLQKVSNAVISTDGEFLSYEEKPILAVFHSSSTGKTESCENVWGTKLPYLVSVDSMEDWESVPQYESTVTISKSNFKETITKNYPKADFSGKWITDTKYSDSGRLLTAKIGGISITGTELRKLFELRSTGMKIEITDEDVVFNVTGYGHGVGMSQYGANAMAQNGNKYDEILAWYYTDTVLTSYKELLQP